MKLEYLAAPGRKTSKKEIKFIALELRKLEKKHDAITPDLVVNAAKNPKAPLHRFFEWDDSQAAENYRLWQARNLIARVYVIDQDRPEVPACRVFVNLEIPPWEEPEDGEDQISQRAYLSLNRLKGKQDFSNQLLEYAYAQLIGWRKRFGNYQQFLDVSKEIEKVKV